VNASQPLEYLLALLDLEIARDPVRGVLHWQGHFVSAADAWQLEQCRQLLARARQWDLEPRLRAIVQQQAARLWRQLGDWGRAIVQLERILQFWQTLEDPLGEVITLNALANLLRLNVERHAEALPLYQQALELARDQSTREFEALTLNNMGLAHYENGQHRAARECFEQALGYFRAINAQRQAAGCWHNLGSVAWTQGRLSEAEQHFTEALTLLKALNDRAGEAETLASLGLVWEAQGQWSEATSAYIEALRILRELGDLYGQAQVLTNLGNVYWLLEDNDAATACYTYGLDLTRWLEDGRLEGQLLTNLGDVHRTQGSYPQAETLYKQALQTKQAAGDERSIKHTQLALGALYHQQHRIGEAETCYLTALRQAEAQSDWRIAVHTLIDLARLAMLEKRTDKARAYLDEAEPLAREAGYPDALGDIAQLRGDILLTIGDADTADLAVRYAEACLYAYAFNARILQRRLNYLAELFRALKEDGMQEAVALMCAMLISAWTELELEDDTSGVIPYFQALREELAA